MHKHTCATWSVMLLVVLSLVVAACGDDDVTATAAAPVTIEWWHIEVSDPGLGLWQDVADEYMAAHPNVTINITVQENEAFKAALATNMQAGDVPDIFQSWGGGSLREQVDAGLVQDITTLAAPWVDQIEPGSLTMMEVDGALYGVPWDLGIVGMWYNKTLFDQAGVEAPIETWEDLLTACETFQAAGIVPIALAEGDKWPGMFWYAELALRIGGADVMQQAAVDQNFDDPAFLTAGEELARLVALDPFNAGFLATPWDSVDGAAAVLANGQAAMLLMGHWAPGTIRVNGPDLAASGELGWFSFPAYEGGGGLGTDAFGGGNGFAVGKDAPPEAVDFLGYLSSLDVGNRVGATGARLPVTIGSEGSVTDPDMAVVLAGRGEATYVQLYLDQAYPPAVGGAVNDAVALLYAEAATPQDVVDAINAAWAAE